MPVPPLPPRRFQVYRETGRTVDTDAWQLLDMAKLYRCIKDFRFDENHEVFHITDADGSHHTLTSVRVRDTYTDAIVSMVDSLLDSDTDIPEFTTETGVKMDTKPVPYILDPLDRIDIFPHHWSSPHGGKTV